MMKSVHSIRVYVYYESAYQLLGNKDCFNSILLVDFIYQTDLDKYYVISLQLNDY